MHVPGPVLLRPVAAGVVVEAVNAAVTTDAAVTAASDPGAVSVPVDSRRAAESLSQEDSLCKDIVTVSKR